jgi:uncharacterized Zn finger protein
MNAPYVLYIDCPKCSPKKGTAQARMAQEGNSGGFTLQYLLAACSACNTRFSIKLEPSP